MASPDHLFALRNSFYVGAFQAAITSSQSALSPDEVVERDALLYRSYIAIGSHQLVIDEIGPGAATPLQAVKLLAVYLSGGVKNKVGYLPSGVGDLETPRAPGRHGGGEQAPPPACGGHHPHARTGSRRSSEAHELRWHHGTLHALNVQIYLQMNRPDHAEKQLRIMQQLDEDHALTQLANAWVNIAMGGSKIQEALLTFQDLSKYPTTCMILNGKAICLMHMGSFGEAEGLLLESLNKDAKDAETLANLIACGLHSGKSASRYLNQLKLTNPDYVLVKRMASAEDSFDRACQAMT